MSISTQKNWEYFETMMEENAHPITKNWFLVPSPGPVLIILAVYLYFCKVAGPRYMKYRKPYELKNIIMIYNLIQILSCFYLFCEATVCAFKIRYNVICETVDYSDNPNTVRVASACWMYFILKLVDLLDTVFFVLRKKEKQISTLHLCHHVMMPIGTWVGVKFLPGGHAGAAGLLNTVVHIVMYTYYLIAGLGPEYQKYLWWKKHLTTIQLIQFFLVLMHNISVFFFECSYPKAMNVVLIVYASTFLVMFGKFYVQTYVKTNKKNS